MGIPTFSLVRASASCPFCKTWQLVGVWAHPNPRIGERVNSMSSLTTPKGNEQGRICNIPIVNSWKYGAAYSPLQFSMTSELIYLWEVITAAGSCRVLNAEKHMIYWGMMTRLDRGAIRLFTLTLPAETQHSRTLMLPNACVTTFMILVSSFLPSWAFPNLCSSLLTHFVWSYVLL